jgi:hypothetical protein
MATPSASDSIQDVLLRQLGERKIALNVHQFSSLMVNGCVQNAYFLYLGFQKIGLRPVFVYEDIRSEGKVKVFAGGALGPDLVVYPVHCEDAPEKLLEYHTFVSTTIRASPQLCSKLEKLGIARVQTKCGANYIMDQEAFLFQLKGYGGFGEIDSQNDNDELWIQDGMKKYVDYFETLGQTPCFVLPNYWNMNIQNKLAAQVGKETPLRKLCDDVSDDAIDILIMESNINICKNAIIPLVICERLLQLNSKEVGTVYAFSFPDNSNAHSMVNKLSLWKQKKLRKFARLVSVEIFSTFAKSQRPVVILTNMLQVPLNYAHFEALYLGFPLVHNSPALRDEGLGYYYEENDIAGAIARIREASALTPETHLAHRDHARAVLARRWDPCSPESSSQLKRVIIGCYVRNLQRNAQKTINMKATFENTFAEKIMCAVLGNASPKGLERRNAFYVQLTSPELKGIPFTIEYRMGIRGSSSCIKEFMQDAEPISLKPQSCANIIALLYENVSALRQFVQDSSKEFLLLMEDDVALSHNFAEQLQAAVYTWMNATGRPRGILRIGYLPMTEENAKQLKFKTPWSHEGYSNEWKTGFQNTVVRSGVNVSAVGSQAVLYTRYGAQELLKVLDAPTLVEIQQRLKAIPYPYRSTYWPLAWDHLLNIPCGDMSFVHPPLAIEGDLSGSSINSSSPVMRWGYAAANGFLDESVYVGSPSWKAAYIAAEQPHNDAMNTEICKVQLMQTRLEKKLKYTAKDLEGSLAGQCDLFICGSQLLVLNATPRNQHALTVFISLFQAQTSAAMASLLEANEALTFFADNVLSTLAHPFVLIVGSEDVTFPNGTGDTRFASLPQPAVQKILSSPLLIHTFVENLDTVDPARFTPIPLGVLPWDGVLPSYEEAMHMLAPALRGTRVFVCHRNHRDGSQWNDRKQVQTLAETQWSAFSFAPSSLTFSQFNEALCKSAFTVCAHGGGFDPSPRAWQALLCGSIPIIKRSPVDGAYAGLPVVFVDEWTADCITVEKLDAWQRELEMRFTDSRERAAVLHQLSLDYWWAKVLEKAHLPNGL